MLSQFTNSRIPIISLEAAVVVRAHFSCAIDVRKNFALTSLCPNVSRRNRSSVREYSSNVIAKEHSSNVLSFIDDNNTVWRPHHLYFRCRAYPTSQLLIRFSVIYETFCCMKSCFLNMHINKAAMKKNIRIS